MMSTENDTVAPDNVESQLKRYDGSITVPNRKFLYLLYTLGCFLMMIMAPLSVVLSFATITYLDSDGFAPFGVPLLLFPMPLVCMIGGMRFISWSRKKHREFFEAVYQGQVLYVGLDRQSNPYLMIRGYTYAMEKKTYRFYPDAKLWEEYFLRYKTEGPFIAQL